MQSRTGMPLVKGALVMGAAVFGALATGCNVSKVATRALARKLESTGFEHQTVQVDVQGHTCTVSLWRGGDGPPLMMLHGFGGNGTWTWEKQLHAFAATREVIVPDLLWFGESSCDAPPTLDSQAEAMLGLLDALGHTQVDVMGVSYGGFTTFAMNLAAPQRIGDVVIVDSPGPVFTDADRQVLLDYLQVEDPAEVFVPDDVDDVRTLLELTFADPPTMPDWAAQDILEHQFSGYPEQKRALLADLDTWQERVSGGDMALDVPEALLVAWGEHDPIFPLDLGRRLAATVDAPLVTVPGARHGPNVEFPELFNPAVLSWLETGSTDDCGLPVELPAGL